MLSALATRLVTKLVHGTQEVRVSVTMQSCLASERDRSLHCGFIGDMALQSDTGSQFLHPHSSSRRQSPACLQHRMPAGREHAVGTWRLRLNGAGQSNKSTGQHLKIIRPNPFHHDLGNCPRSTGYGTHPKSNRFLSPAAQVPELLARSPTEIT